MANCAVVQSSDNIVINKIVADITDIPQEGCFLVSCDGLECDIGWVYNGLSFIPVVENIDGN